jgi:hypothetical protein
VSFCFPKRDPDPGDIGDAVARRCSRHCSPFSKQGDAVRVQWIGPFSPSSGFERMPPCGQDAPCSRRRSPRRRYAATGRSARYRRCTPRRDSRRRRDRRLSSSRGSSDQGAWRDGDPARAAVVCAMSGVRSARWCGAGGRGGAGPPAAGSRTRTARSRAADA